MSSPAPTLLVDPPEHGRYLRALQACFPGWGDGDMYAWCFSRSASARAPERLVFRDEDGRWLAGSAISYRTVRVGCESTLVGIMSGSWTLPAARGQGLFTRFIDESCARVRAHGGMALLAFVTEGNRSRLRLEAADARMVPTTYAVKEAAECPGPARFEALPESEDNLEDVYRRWQRRTDGAGAAIAYADLPSFAGQFVKRPVATEILAGPGDARAVIERAAATDRVLFLDEGEQDRAAVLRALGGRAANAGRNLFAFGIGPEAAGVFAAAGMRPMPGFLTVLAAGDDDASAEVARTLAAATWEIQSGDRM